MTFDYEPQILPGSRVLYVNASSLKLLDCDFKYALTVRGYHGDKGDTSILDIGSALHKYAETYTRNAGEHLEALMAARKDYPNVPVKTLVAATARRTSVVLPPAIEVDGEMLVEAKFSQPWLRTVVNGKVIQIVLCGTMDHVGYGEGGVRIIDYKSTHYVAMKSALDKYAHESQFKFYMWVLWKFGASMLPLNLYNDVREGKFSSQVCIIQVNGTDPRWYLDKKRYMTDYQFRTYECALKAMLPRMVESFTADSPNANGMLCNACQYCEYKKVCFAESIAERTAEFDLLTNSWYDPLNRTN